jgi:small subunit ribosomal protein S2
MSEAKRLGITTFGMVDTNCDPNKVEFPVPANDDATKSIAIITNYITAAIAEGLAERQAEKAEEDEAEESTENALKFSVEEDAENAEGGKRAAGKAGAPKRRVPAAGTGGRRPAQKK